MRVVPANEVSDSELLAIFGTRGDAGRCQCQRYRLGWHEFHALTVADRAELLLDQTHCGDPASSDTSGIVLFVEDEPAGWCAVSPRSDYAYLRQTPWKGRDEDKDDETVWAATCFVLRVGYRRRGLMSVLAAGAVEHARSRGARALEAYPMVTEPGREITWGELSVGSRNVLADAGFREVTHPSKRRYVMRIDF